MKPLVFAVTASHETGLGHLMRCLALAQAAEEQSIPCLFLLTPEGAKAAKTRHDWHYEIRLRPEGQDMAGQGKWLEQVALEVNAAAIIVDGYDFTPAFLNPGRASGCKIVVLDDGAKTLVGQADIVVNPALKDTSDYQTLNPSARFLTGGRYRLLRREFTSLVPPSIEQRHGIAVNMGGSDPQQLTLPVLKMLGRELPDVPVRIVTGAAFSRLQELEQYIARSSQPIQHIHNCQDMSEVWLNAKLAISAAGGSQFELGVCQTPSLLMVVANNQLPAALNAEKEGWCEQFDCRKDAPLEQIVQRVKVLLGDEQQLRDMQQASQGKYDAHGALRVLTAIGELVSET